MSDAKNTHRVTEAPVRDKNVPQTRGHGPMAAMSNEKAINFGPSLKRLLGNLRPERPRIIVVTILTAVAVVLNVVNPKILGEMTNLLFAGLVGKNLPAGVPLEQIIAGMLDDLERHRGNEQARLFVGEHITTTVRDIEGKFYQLSTASGGARKRLLREIDHGADELQRAIEIQDAALERYNER